ncbi:MAG: hypothetical protein QXD81_05045 [Candidatus Bathyarchaeia archaeon]
MKTIGQVFQLKEPFLDIKSELTPSFDEVIRSYLGQHVKTKFKDPIYAMEITYPTPPLQAFIKRIIEGLTMPTVQGTYLIRGFGFGKTHAIILLWHMLNSKEGASSQLAKQLGLEEGMAQETLALGIDFSKERPLPHLFNQLEAMAKRQPERWQIKDPKLSNAAIEVIKEINRTKALALSSEELANLIIKILERYRGEKANSRLLLLIDELGIGIISRLTSYIETQKEERYGEIEYMINFIEQLYARLNGRGIPAYIVVALAEQDIREMDHIWLQQADKPIIQAKIDGLRKRLSILKERLSRAAGGLSEEAALSHDPEHAINIAKHRVLRKIEAEGEKGVENALLSYLALQAQQYNLQEAFEAHREQIKNYYPLSPSMIWLLKKILNPHDAPRTEYVRTTLNILAEAAENALKLEPHKALAIGAKHMPPARAGIIDLMGDFEAEWASAVSDMEHAIRSANPEIQKTVEIIAKQILAKGTTANVTALMEVRDLRELKRYAVSPEEMQMDILTTLPPEEAIKAITQLQNAMEYLKTQSARIEEKEYEGEKFYMPSLMRTIYDKLAAFVAEHRRILEEPTQLPTYLQQANLPGLFSKPRAGIPSREDEVIVFLKEYNIVANVDALINSMDVRDAQNGGNLSIILVPPWDAFLFNELYQRKTDYHTLANTIAQKLQSVNLAGRISHPLHLIVLLPKIDQDRLSRLMDDVISYAAVKDFIQHLKNRERILEEKMYDYERTVQKRLTLRLTEFFEEQRKKLEIGLKSSIERQLRDATSSAQKELIKLTRKIATSAMELYEDVIFYSIQSQSFTTQSLIKLFGELHGEASKLEQSGKSDLSEYSCIMNAFFRRVIESTGFIWEPDKISDAIYKYYKMEIESGVIRRQDRMSEIIENAMLGTYEIKPLSSKVVKEALIKLDGRAIEAENKKVVLKIDGKQGHIAFEIEEIKPVGIEGKPSEISPEAIPIHPGGPPLVSERALSEVIIKIDQNFNFEDFKQKLNSLYQTYGTLINSIKIETSGNLIRVSFDFLGSGHNADTIIGATRFLRQISNRYNTTPQFEIKFASMLPEEKLQEILGSFFTKKVMRSWDKLLPS